MPESTPLFSGGSARMMAIRQRQAVCRDIPSSLAAMRQDQGVSVSNIFRASSMRRSGRRTRAKGVPVDPHQVAPQRPQRHLCAPVRVLPHRHRSLWEHRGQAPLSLRLAPNSSITTTASTRRRDQVRASANCVICCGVRSERLERMRVKVLWSKASLRQMAETQYWPFQAKRRLRQHAMLTPPKRQLLGFNRNEDTIIGLCLQLKPFDVDCTGERVNE